MCDRSAIPGLLVIFFFLIGHGTVSGSESLDKINFRHNYLASVPSDIIPPHENVKDITKAIFSHNYFNALTVSDFEVLSQFPNLKYVFFDHNNISSIESNAFAQVPNIKFIELAHNRLEEISDTLYDDLAKLKWLQFVNLKRNPIKNYKNIDKLAARGIQIDYDGMSGREKKMRLKSANLVSDGSINKGEVDKGEHDNVVSEEVDGSEEDNGNVTRISDKPIKAFVIDHQMEQSAYDPTFKMNNNFLSSIIFNFFAAFLVLVALPIAMVIYYFVHRKRGFS